MGYESVLNELMNSGNFEKQNFEKEYHAEEVVEKLAKAMDVNPIIAAKILAGYGNKSKASSIDEIIMNSTGDLNITVTRATNTIAGVALPFVIFGLNDFGSQYSSTLRTFLPAGITVVVATTATGSVTFTYTDGVHTDVVTVAFIGRTNYQAFLQSLNQSRFDTHYLQYTISDTTKQAQFNQMLNWGAISSLGATKDNQLLPITRRRATDFQAGIIEILVPKQTVDPTFSIVQSIIDSGIANFTIGMNVYMDGTANVQR